MGMDGLSIANTGAVKESTSADYASKTEHAIHADTTNESRQVQSLGVNQRVRPKDDDEETNRPPRDNSEFQDGLVEEGQEVAAAVTLNYGNFLQVTFDFLVIAFSVFLFVRLLSRLNRKKEKPAAPAAPPAPSKEELLLTEIRDLLKEQVREEKK